MGLADGQAWERDYPAGESTKAEKQVTITEDQIVVSRQSLLEVVRALDLGRSDMSRIPNALDDLREPFFSDEMSSGQARRDFSVNKY